MDDVIVEWQYDLKISEDRSEPVILQIGKSIQSSECDIVWLCPITITGPDFDFSNEIPGSAPLMALSMAMFVVQSVAESLKLEYGDAITYRGGGDLWPNIKISMVVDGKVLDD